MQHYLKGFLLLFLGFFLTACSSPDSPKGIAKSFWDGVLAQDVAVVKQFSTTQTQSAVDFSKSTVDWKMMTVKLGSTDIAGDNATVHTEVLDKASGQKYIFNTYLVRENGAWRVDYVRTRQASVTSEVFSNLVKSLQKLNQSLVEHYDDTLAGFAQAAPALKTELDNLSDNLAKKPVGEHPTMHERLDALKLAIKNMFAEHKETAPATSGSTPAKTSTTPAPAH